MTFHIVLKRNTVCLVQKYTDEHDKRKEKYIGSLDMTKTDLTLSEFRKVFNEVADGKRINFCKSFGVMRPGKVIK